MPRPTNGSRNAEDEKRSAVEMAMGRGDSRKHCASCGNAEPKNALLCLDCHEVFEDATWLRFVYVTLAVSLLAEIVFHFSGHHTFRISEVFINEALLLTLSYPLVKFLQWKRDPERPVVAEFFPVFSDRSMRFAVIAVCAYVIYAVIKVAIAFSGAAPVFIWSVWIVFWLAAVLFAACFIVVGGIFWQYGLSSLAPRIENVVWETESRRLLDDEN